MELLDFFKHVTNTAFQSHKHKYTFVILEESDVNYVWTLGFKIC